MTEDLYCLTLTKVVFELQRFLFVLNGFIRLTLTKVVFESENCSCNT